MPPLPQQAVCQEPLQGLSEVGEPCGDPKRPFDLAPPLFLLFLQEIVSVVLAITAKILEIAPHGGRKNSEK
jgi:hypothetical protein